MSNIISHDVVLSLEKKLPFGYKKLLANRLKLSPSAIYMMFSGERGMRKEYFDEAIKILDEYKYANKQYTNLLKKI